MLFNKEYFNKIIRTNVFWRTFIIIISVAFLSIAASLMMAAFHYEREAVIQINNSHNLLAERMAKEMGLFFDQSVFQVVMIADIMDALWLNPEDARVTLNRTALNSPYITEIASTDADGRTIASSTTKDVERDFSATEPFRHAIKGETYVSPVILDANGVPYVFVSTPVYDVATPRGAVIAELGLKKLWWWIDEINNMTGVTLTVIKPDDGIVVADQSKSTIGKPYEHWNGEGKSVLVKSEGEKLYVTFHNTPRVNLTLVLITRMDPFLTHIYQIRYALFALGLAILLIAGVIAGAISWRSARPVMALVEGMEIYAKDPGHSRMETHMPGEFKKIAVAFNKMLDTVEEKQKLIIQQESMVRVGRLASIISHELRHGLHVILNIVFMIDEVKQETKTLMNKLVQDMVSKIASIMEFTRAGNMVPEDVNPDMILLQAAENVKYSDIAKGKKILVNNHRKDQLVIHVDRNKTVTAIANMARNSLEAECTTVSLAWNMLKDGTIEFSVSDDGNGISDENLGRVFEPFFSSKRKGFGIGLSMAELVANAHGGKVWIHKTGPLGTEVRMIMPVRPPKKEVDANAAKTGSELPQSVNLGV